MLKKSIPIVCVTALIFCWALLAASQSLGKKEPEEEDQYKTYGAAQAKKVSSQPSKWITADHSEHKALQKDFSTGPQVTESCLSCHNEAAAQIQETIHWTWLCPADPNKEMGKRGVSMNNF